MSAREAMKLAEWLTNEDNQLLRFEERELGPANAEAAQSDKVKNNIALAALAKQNEFGVSQRGIKSTFWSPVEAFGTAMETKDYSRAPKVTLKKLRHPWAVCCLPCPKRWQRVPR